MAFSTPVSVTGDDPCACCVVTECCPGATLPFRLFATITAAWCAAIDGAVIPIVWDGVDSYYGEIDTGCTNCDRYFVRLQCVAGEFVLTDGFFSTDPGSRPCVNPDPGPGCTSSGSVTPFDCDTLTASITTYYGTIDVVGGVCCSPSPLACDAVTVDLAA